MLDPLRTSIYLLVIVGIAAAASSGLIRSVEFKSLLFREERSLPDAIAMAQEAGRKYVTIASRVLAGK